MSAVKYNVGGRIHPRFRIVQGNVQVWPLRGSGGALPGTLTLDFRRHRKNWPFYETKNIFRWPVYGTSATPAATTGGHFVPLTKKQLAKLNRDAERLEKIRHGEWEASESDRAAIRAELLARMRGEPWPPLQPISPEIPLTDDGEDDIELLLLSL